MNDDRAARETLARTAAVGTATVRALIEIANSGELPQLVAALEHLDPDQARDALAVMVWFHRDRQQGAAIRVTSDDATVDRLLEVAELGRFPLVRSEVAATNEAAVKAALGNLIWLYREARLDATAADLGMGPN